MSIKEAYARIYDMYKESDSWPFVSFRDIERAKGEGLKLALEILEEEYPELKEKR